MLDKSTTQQCAFTNAFMTYQYPYRQIRHQVRISSVEEKILFESSVIFVFSVFRSKQTFDCCIIKF